MVSVCYDSIIKCFRNWREERSFKLAQYFENSYHNSRTAWLIETVYRLELNMISKKGSFFCHSWSTRYRYTSAIGVLYQNSALFFVYLFNFEKLKFTFIYI